MSNGPISVPGTRLIDYYNLHSAFVLMKARGREDHLVVKCWLEKNDDKMEAVRKKITEAMGADWIPTWDRPKRSGNVRGERRTIVVIVREG